METGGKSLRGVEVLRCWSVEVGLYHYSTITYIGGGFSKDGIHNVLEPAAFGKPVIFGPNYSKYREAKDLVGKGAAFSFGHLLIDARRQFLQVFIPLWMIHLRD